jgi:hypothetical protein
VQPLDHATQRRIRQLDVQGNHRSVLAGGLIATEPVSTTTRKFPSCRRRTPMRCAPSGSDFTELAVYDGVQREARHCTAPGALMGTSNFPALTALQ